MNYTTIGKTEERRLLAFETWCYKMMLRISWTKYIITIEDVNQRVKITSFFKTLKTRRAKLIRHILRHNSLLSRIMKSAIERENSRGWLH